MIGPFKKAQGGYTHILVAIDKFTKWIEFKPIASLTSTKTVEFIQDIIFRFGIPNSIITDLGSNFTSSEFFDFCEQKSIQIKYGANNASVVNVADVGGLYNGQWIQAVSRWLTTVYTKTTVKLPKTGY